MTDDRTDCASYPKGGSFRVLLHWHIYVNGTRPNGDPDIPGSERWPVQALAQKIAANPEGEDAAKGWIYTWLKRDFGNPQLYLKPLEYALFGNNRKYDPWRKDLRRAARALGKTTRRSGIRPVQPARCIGRAIEIEELVTKLSAVDLAVIVSGGPGIGKTTLTRAVASHPDVVTRFGDRRYFVALENARSLKAFQSAVRQALPGTEITSAPIETILKSLRSDPVLLVFDNLETPWGVAPVEIENELAVAASMSGISFIASLRGNELPLSPTWSMSLSLGPLDQAAAAELFLALAPAVASDDPDLGIFLTELGGVPLAIELIAMEVHAAGQIADALKEWRRVGAVMARRHQGEETRLTSLAHSIEVTLNSSRRHARSKDFLSYIASMPDGVDEEFCAFVLGGDDYFVRRDIVSSGLAFRSGRRIRLLRPIANYMTHLAPLSEIMIRDAIGYFLRSSDKLCASLPNIDDEAVDRFLSSERNNMSHVITFAPHRIHLSEFDQLATNLLSCIAELRPATQIQEFHFWGLAVLKALGAATDYIALRVMMNFQDQAFFRFWELSSAVIGAEGRLMLRNAYWAIDELEKAIVDFSPGAQIAAHKLVADMRKEAAKVEAPPSPERLAQIISDRRLDRISGENLHSLEAISSFATYARDSLHLVGYEGRYAYGLEKAQSAFDNWDGPNSPELLYSTLVEAFGAGHPISLQSAHLLAEALIERGSIEEALRLYGNIAEHEQDTIAAGNPLTQRGLATALSALGRNDEADDHARLASELEAIKSAIFSPG